MMPEKDHFMHDQVIREDPSQIGAGAYSGLEKVPSISENVSSMFHVSSSLCPRGSVRTGLCYKQGLIRLFLCLRASPPSVGPHQTQEPLPSTRLDIAPPRFLAVRALIQRGPLSEVVPPPHSSITKILCARLPAGLGAWPVSVCAVPAWAPA